MPIDTSMYLPLIEKTPAPPAIEDGLQRSQRALNLSQQTAMGPINQEKAAQDVQSGALAIQQTEQELKDQQIYADALKSASQPAPVAPGSAPAGAPGAAPGAAAPAIAPPDPNVVLMNMLRDPRGLSGKAAQSYMNTMLANREKNAAIAKDTAAAQADQANAQGKHAEAIVGATGSLINLGAPDDPAAEAARAAAYPQVRAQLISSGHLTADQVPPDYPGIAWLTQEHNGLQTGIQQLAEQKQASDLKIAQAKAAHDAKMAPSEEATAQNVAATGAPNAAGLTAAQQKEADDRAATLRETQARDTTTAKNEAARLKIEQDTFNNNFGAPGTVSPAAQMAADGRMDPQTLRSMLRKQPGLVAQIQKVDPSFDEGNIDNRYKVLQGFGSSTPSSLGGQQLALNTLVHHADLYMQTADALKNHTFVPGNALWNEVASVFGSAPPQQADLVARFFAGETGKVATGGVPAEGEINGILKSLGSSSSPEQIHGAGDKLLQIAAGRAIPLNEKVKEAKLQSIVHVMGPDAQEILKRRGFDPDTLKPAAGADSGMITVQIPGQPPGQIHASQKAAFLKQYPDAVVK